MQLPVREKSQSTAAPPSSSPSAPLMTNHIESVWLGFLRIHISRERRDWYAHDSLQDRSQKACTLRLLSKQVDRRELCQSYQLVGVQDNLDSSELKPHHGHDGYRAMSIAA